MKNHGHYTVKDVGKPVTVQGFVQKKRDLGHLLFIDLRDRTGLIQLAFEADHPLKDAALALKNEWVIEATGIIRERAAKNKELATGDIEIRIDTLTVHSTAKHPPMLIQDDTDALEETRLKYRYLDLRRPVIQNNLKIRHTIMQAVRQFLNPLDFLEIETPILTRSTPEGARDYVVPSRLYEDEFYALPQSPQIFKQLLMVGGLEKYYQIAKCFRDEDLRKDRQPEFTQIDIETAFLSADEIIDLAENLVRAIFSAAKEPLNSAPFQRLTYQEAMDTYGSDKPDLRFGLMFSDYQDTLGTLDLPFIHNQPVKGFTVPGGTKTLTRKVLDGFKDRLTGLSATLSVIKKDESLSGSLVKHLPDKVHAALDASLRAGDVLIVCAGKDACAGLGRIRLAVRDQLNLTEGAPHEAAIITDWPMFEYDDETKRYYATHHPFTLPKGTLEEIQSSPDALMSYAYDVVINGHEVGGGSLRIHNARVQDAVFRHLGLSEEEAHARFGFFLDAMEYGVPPHGGIAFGLDRLTMILSHTDNIRDVIAFPKTSSAQDLMSDAPGPISDAQKKELHLL